MKNLFEKLKSKNITKLKNYIMIKKLRRIVALCLISGSLITVSCEENKNDENDETMEHEMHEEEQMHHEMSKSEHNHADVHTSNGEMEITAEFQDEHVAALYEYYSNIKTALVRTNSEMAKNSANRFLAVAESSQFGADMVAAAKQIAGSSNVQKQRQAFSLLSKVIEEHLREEIVSGTIYKQYCPMAFDGKGDYWFANSKEIKNPYFGEKMLNCGRVEETLN